VSDGELGEREAGIMDAMKEPGVIGPEGASVEKGAAYTLDCHANVVHRGKKLIGNGLVIPRRAKEHPISGYRCWWQHCTEFRGIE